MSATALQEEEFAGSRTCQVLILCEDMAAYERAADVCWRILVQLADDLEFGFKCWNFIELSDPACARAVLKTASASDVILLSLHNPDLPPVAAEWLEAFSGHRLRAEGVLALVLNEPPGAPDAVNRLSRRLENSARKLGMDFLSLAKTSVGESSPLEDAAQFDVAREARELPARRDCDHWGLNE